VKKKGKGKGGGREGEDMAVFDFDE